LLTPFQVAVIVIDPLAAVLAVTVNAALEAPCGTVTLAGTARAALLVEIPTLIEPAAFDSVTVQLLFAPTARVVG